MAAERQAALQSASCHVSWTLDQLGYGPAQRQFRKNFYKEKGRLNTYCMTDLKTIYHVGSKGEGLTTVFESDHDLLFVLDDVICFERGAQGIESVSKLVTVLSMDQTLSYPGHTSLELMRWKNELFIQKIVLDSTEILTDPNSDDIIGILISSKMFLDNVAKGFQSVAPDSLKLHPTAGPSTPASHFNMHTDRVYSFRCVCPGILTEWHNRPRKHNWPPPELLDEIRTMEGFVVPNGHAGSFCKDLDWRICFNTAEMKLLDSLNDTQTKLYILLKMVKSDILKPQNKEVTSFALKNMVFWLAEMHPQESFPTNSLLDWLMRALCMLKRSIEVNMLPYYMIPARSLLPLSWKPDQRKRLLSRLESIIRMGPVFVLKCRKLRLAADTMPSQKVSQLKLKFEIEKLYLFGYYVSLLARYPGMTMSQIVATYNTPCYLVLEQKLLDCVIPGWKTSGKTMDELGDKLREKLERILR